MTEQRTCAYERCEAAADGAQRVDGGVGTRGGNVRSVSEARDLQTASKALDRWRLVMELQIHRTLLETGHFHIDDLDCLNLPAEAFRVRGTLVSSVRRSGVMRSTGVYRKVSHKAANGRPAPIYEITPEGKEQLPTLIGSTSCPSLGHSGAAAGRPGEEQPGPTAGSDTMETRKGERDEVEQTPTAPSTGRGLVTEAVPNGAGSPGGVRSGEGSIEVGSPQRRKSDDVAPPPTVAADLGSSPHSLVQLDGVKPKPRNAIFDEDWDEVA